MFDGLIFGFLAWLSLAITWNHFPVWVKRFTINHPLLTDIATTFITYFTISSITSSLPGAIASLFTGLLTEISLLILRNKPVSHPR